MRGRVPLMLGLMVMSSLGGCLGAFEDGGLLDFDGEEVELHGVPGGLVLACVRSSTFTSMVLEVDHEDGYKPEQQSLNTLKQRLEQVCDKPGGITIVTTVVDFSHEGAWTAEDIRDIGWETRETPPQDGETLRWHLLFPSGSYENDGVLGVAVDASTAAVFLDDVRDAEGFLSRPSAEEIEEAVMIHEVGHLLGLVNLVYQSPVDHEDEDHPGHSNNDQSVMYWAIESSDVSSFVSNDVPDEFDADDLADLAGIADGSIEVDDQLWTD